MTRPILLPNCPRCGNPPLLLGLPVIPYFCETKGCTVFSWDPYVSREQFEASARLVELPDLGGGE